MNLYQLKFKDGQFAVVLADSVILTNDETNPGLEMYQNDDLVVAIPPGGWLALLRGTSNLSEEDIVKFRDFAKSVVLTGDDE